MASSSSSVQHKHDVFLSFRGEDTRYNFISHLYAALQRKSIETFIDNDLTRGKEISPALLKAIQESKISIVILSQHYASSSWCLEELCKILECKNTYEKIVVPIFYHVNPSDVRNQTGSFAEAFAKHEEERTEKVQRWRDAFKEIGNLSGSHFQKDRSEYEHIEEIVEDISKKLIYKSSNDSKGLVGLNLRIGQIESLLCINKEDVRIVGIWGMGGIGKTTLAEAVFNQYCAEFEVYCFLTNVREELEKHGKVQLWEKLLSTILEERNLCIGTHLLSNFIRDKLSRKKALIVLDDVNDSLQLDILPEKNCFGLGSRIIITSRDKQVLQQVVDGDDIYEVKELVVDDALQLFSLNAFKQRHPLEGWMELSKMVIYYAKGVPLALKILGSDLYGKSKPEWESFLNRLKEIPNPNIFKILRISYDGLHIDEKGIFLDIACFFEGEDRDYVIEILDGCYSSVYYVISVLIEKSLITISHNKLRMHDLIQEMGWNIVRQEFIKEPGKCSRLWIPKEVYQVLKNNSGTEATEGIFLDMSKIRELRLTRPTFGSMYNLRLLKLYYSDSKRDPKLYLSQKVLEGLSDKLCYFHWVGYPLKSLPSNFCPENLVELNMTYSHVKRLWNGVQNLVNLKRLDLSYSQHLAEIPDLLHATNLERMTLKGCESLVEVPSSIGYLTELSYLSLVDCKNLKNLPNISHLISLKSLLLSGCSNITQFPEIPRELEFLYLDGSAIEEVPSLVGSLSGLKVLNLNYCENLERLPSSFCKLKCLSHLKLSCCSKFKSFQEIFKNTGSLEYLDLNGTRIEELPSSIEHLIDLQFLDLRNCKKLKNFPTGIWKLKSLYKLSLSGCSSLKFPEVLEYIEESEFKRDIYEFKEVNLQNCTEFDSLPNGISNISLDDLCLNDCNLLEFPRWLTCISSLRRLDLKGNHFESISPSIKQLSVLESLDLSYCRRLQSIPELPPSLCNLVADCCTALEVVSRFRVDDLGTRATFAFTNCLKLDQHAMGSIAAEAQLRIQQRATEYLDLSHKLSPSSSLLKAKESTTADVDLSYMARYQEPSITICFLGSEIPECYACQSTGSTISILLPERWHDFKFVGFTLCVVVTFDTFEDYNNDDSYFSVRCQCKFKTNHGDCLALHCPLFSWVNRKGKPRFVVSDHVFLGYNLWLYASWNGEYHSNELSFDFDVIDIEGNPVDCCKVKKCGVHLIYIHDENLVSIHEPIRETDTGTGSSDLLYAQDTECNPNHNSTQLSLKCGVINQDFGEPIVEDGAVIKTSCDDYCYIEATPSKNSSSNEEEEEHSLKD